MSKSIFEVIANYYNIELNKPFKIRYKRNGQEYDVRFKKESIDLLNPISNKWVASFTPLEAILEEYVDIILPPFIPVLGDTYWFVAINQYTDTLEVDCASWANGLMDFQLLKGKNVFRTKEDAEKRLSCAMADLLKVKEEYEVNANSCLINGDSYEQVNNIYDDSIDLIVTSPPYNVDLGNNKYNKNKYNSYDDNLPHETYLAKLKGLFTDLYPKLKKGARVCINIGAKANGRIATHSDIIQMMNDIGYLNVTQIIWDKSQVGNRTSWGSFCSPSCPSFPTPFEYILVFAKETLKLQEKGETDLTKEEFIDWSLALWRFPPESQMKKYGHPAMFPKELPKRLIKMFSWKGATVLDPFSGMGTTGVVCKELGRNYIGIELDPMYCQLALERIEATEEL